jgi:glycosyltransferase involved in cell wall biosynthesis
MGCRGRDPRLAAPARTGAARPGVLFVHDAGPGQFGPLGRHLARQGWPVTFAATRPVDVPLCTAFTYAPHRAPAAETHPYAQPFDRAALTAQGFARAALAMRRQGLRPDVVVSHAGTGAGLLAAEAFPGVRTVAYAEWWYAHPAPDLVYLDARAPLPDAEQAMVERTRNAAMALEIASADATLCPTAFQARQFPQALQAALTLHHDGIDTHLLTPAPARSTDAACPEALRGLPDDAPLVTYATRGMEPHRGFPQFMAAVPAIQRAHPDAVVAIAGENTVCYGTEAMRGVDWLARGLAEPGIDRARLVLLGTLPGPAYRWLLRRSDAHVYLTTPFVLSWSLLEAMACACPLVASDTEPVREFAAPDAATLVDMRAPGAIAEAVGRTLTDAEAARGRGAAARRAIVDRVPASRLLDEKAAFLRQL